MNRLQERINDEITPRSMVSALLWDQAWLQEPDIALVLNLDGCAFFECNQKELDEELKKWEPQSAVDGEDVWVNYQNLMMQMRQAEYVFWPYQFRENRPTNGGVNRGSWVLIVMRIETIELSTDLYDRYASQIAIIDPRPESDPNLEHRGDSIVQRLPLLLEHAHIRVDDDSWIDDVFDVPDVLQDWNAWATGHQCYLYAHELFRRLRFQWGTQRGQFVESFWQPIQEGFNSELARKLMASACAHRAIEKSEYYGRLAIEFPGFASSADAYNYRPSAVDSRTEAQKEFDGSKAAENPTRMIINRPRDIGLWSKWLDADQRWKGKWTYVRAQGAFPEGPNLTRDEARYEANRQTQLDDPDL
ncbi:hypothetical protein PG994_000311 [Apiospora phragmitis]|uniref:Uncharacterized protein n=1 Tax=Apiospora phragmitis TaxID=2905665 RepID=A0ABR1X5W2_9PEZI